jgi:hypothetical protein
VRIFRHLEQQTLLVEVEPTAQDLALHRFAIDCLLAIGRELLFRADRIADEDFARFGFSRGNLAAYVAELEHSLSEWHGNLGGLRGVVSKNINIGVLRGVVS